MTATVHLPNTPSKAFARRREGSASGTAPYHTVLYHRPSGPYNTITEKELLPVCCRIFRRQRLAHEASVVQGRTSHQCERSLGNSVSQGLGGEGCTVSAELLLYQQLL